LAFAETHPDLFTLMFNARIEFVDDPGFSDAAEDAFAVLADAWAPFEPVAPLPQSTETLVWSLVHGLASLDMIGRIQRRISGPNRPEIKYILPRLKLKDP